MKTDIQNQIAIYTDRLNTLKVNHYNERHTLTDEGTRSFDEQIIMTAEFIQVLKKQKNEIQARIDEILADERMSYKSATVFANAPLAMIQWAFETELHTLQKVLGVELTKIKVLRGE